MAKFGIDVTGMSEAATGAAKFIRQPIADTGKVELLGTALDMAVDAYEGYQMADLESAQEAEIDAYMQSKNNPNIIAQAQADIGGLEAATESLWKRASTDADLSVEDFTGIEKSQLESMNKLKAALDQGVMTPDQFAQRILATTREAVNRNPGLHGKLVAHSQRILELSGISDVLKADAEMAKDKQKQQLDLQKRYLELADKHNIAYPYDESGGINFTNLVGKVNRAQELQRTLTEIQSVDKIDSTERIMQAKQWITEKGVGYVTAELDDTMFKGITLLKQGDYQGAITQIRMELLNKRQAILSKLSPIINEPQVKEVIAQLDKQSAVIEDVLSKAGSQEDAVRLSNNLQTLLRNKQYEDLSKHVNPEAMKSITALMTAIGPGKVLSSDPKLMNDVMTTLGNIYSGISGGLGTNYNLNIGPDNAVALGVKEIARDAVKDPTKLPLLEKALNTISQDVNNPEVVKSVADKFNFYHKMIDNLASPEVKVGLSQLGAEAYSSATGMVDDYMNLIVPDMIKQIASWESKGVQVTLDALPDGRVVYQTSDPKATRDLNSRYTQRINASLNATANLMNTDSVTAAKSGFYQKYIPAIAGDKDLQALNIKTPSDLENALQSGKITSDQYRAIKQEGFGTQFKSEKEMRTDKKLSELEDKIVNLSGAEQAKAVKEHQQYLKDVYGVTF